MLRAFGAFFLFFWLSSTHATIIEYDIIENKVINNGQQTIVAEVTYSLDSSESIDEARAKLIEYSSQKASDSVSELVLKSSSLLNGVISKEAIKVIGAALIDTEITKESIDKRKTGFVYNMTLIHTLNSEGISQAIINSSKDDSLILELEQLKAQNKKLKANAKVVDPIINKTIFSWKDSPSPTPKKYADSFNEIASVFNKLINGLTSTNLTIVKNEISVSKDFNTHTYGPSWSLKVKGLDKLFESYFYLVRDENDIAVYALLSNKGKTKTPFSQDLLEVISKKGAISIEARVGERSAVLPLLTTCTDHTIACTSAPYFLKGRQGYIVVNKTEKAFDPSFNPTIFLITRKTGNKKDLVFSVIRGHFHKLWRSIDSSRYFNIIEGLWY